MSTKKNPYPDVKGKVEVIDPDKAVSMLQGKNRPVSKARVAKFAQAMRDEKFEFNGEPVIVSDTNLLLDGQHRLLALIEAGVTLPFYVIRGVSESAFASMGQQKPRSFADVMAMDGHANYVHVAALARLVFQYQNRLLTGRQGLGIAVKSRTNQATIDDIRQVVSDYPEIHDAITQSSPLHSRTGVFKGFGTAACFIHFAHLRNPTPGGEKFLEELKTKLGWEKSSPSYSLDRVISNMVVGPKKRATRT